MSSAVGRSQDGGCDTPCCTLACLQQGISWPHIISSAAVDKPSSHLQQMLHAIIFCQPQTWLAVSTMYEE